MTSNYSSSGAPIPFQTANTYTEPGLDYSTLQDSYGRTYQGSTSDPELFTRCYNNTMVSCPVTALWAAGGLIVACLEGAVFCLQAWLQNVSGACRRALQCGSA